MTLGLERRDAGTGAIGACILTVAGGAMDAWVYLDHGHVFANAQTGNIVLLAVDLTTGKVDQAVHILPSIAAFVAGLLLSRLLGAWLKRLGVNSRTARLGLECVLLVGLALVARRLPDHVVIGSVGFVAALQITTLSHIGSASFNTGMTTGNLRAAVSAASRAWLEGGGATDLWKAAMYGAMCLAFLLGALVGGWAAPRIGDATALLIAALVAGAALLMRSLPDPLGR